MKHTSRLSQIVDDPEERKGAVLKYGDCVPEGLGAIWPRGKQILGSAREQIAAERRAYDTMTSIRTNNQING